MFIRIVVAHTICDYCSTHTMKFNADEVNMHLHARHWGCMSQRFDVYNFVCFPIQLFELA